MSKGDFKGLIYELPDFIEGKIDDISLKNQIISLIEEDMDFRMEYESLKNSMASVRNTEFQLPGNEYFSNLTLRINKKIDEINDKPGILVKFREIFINWKFATVFSVLLITVIFYKSGLIYRGGSTYLQERVSEITENNNQMNLIDSSKIIIDEQDDEFVDFEDDNNTSPDKVRNKAVKYQNKRNKNENTTNSFFDVSEDSQLNFSGDNFSIEEEFEKMTPKQQKEFLKNLENLKL